MTTTGIPARTPPDVPRDHAEEPRPPRSALLYDGRRFDGPRLRRAIVRRGWTLRSFAEATGQGHFVGLSETTVREACRGKGTHDTTAIRILQTLGSRQPLLLPEDELAV